MREVPQRLAGPSEETPKKKKKKKSDKCINHFIQLYSFRYGLNFIKIGGTVIELFTGGRGDLYFATVTLNLTL